MTKKKGLLLFFLGICLLAPLAATADEDQDIEYAEIQKLATGSMFLDITRAGTGFVAVGERGHVAVSPDGKNWAQAEIVPTRSTLTTVFSADGRLWAGGHDTVIITSGDGGKTWTRQMFDPERQQGIMDIYFSDAQNGIAIGSYGLALYTSDGGQNWDDQPVDEDNQFHLNSLIKFEDGRMMIAGEAGYSYRSFDDGMSWESMDLPYAGSMWGLVRLENDCVLFYGLRGHVIETCDFGSSWNELDTGAQSSISGAAEHDGLVVFAGNSGVILTRDDGGVMTTYHHSSGVDFATILSLGNGRFLLGGEDGFHLFPESAGEGND